MDPNEIGEIMNDVQANTLENVILMSEDELNEVVVTRMGMQPGPYTRNRNLAYSTVLRLMTDIPFVPKELWESAASTMVDVAAQNLGELIDYPGKRAPFNMLAERARPVDIVRACYASWETAIACQEMMEEMFRNGS